MNESAFRYDTSGFWFKGNTHIHSIASDGGMTVPELAELYSKEKYDFLFITDHWVSSDVQNSCPDPPLLLIDGIELDGKDRTGAYFHVVCIGRTREIRKDEGFEKAMAKVREQGALRILAHPHWCGNTLEDACRESYDGVEVYNHECNWLNGKSCGLVHWESMLKGGRNVLCFSADDAHLKKDHPCWNGGWIVVNSPLCTQESIFSAIRKGNYYSSCGPAIHSLILDEEILTIECSPVRNIRLVGPAFYSQRENASEGNTLERGSFRIPRDWEFVYLELEDQQGKKAWSNTLFV